MTVAELLRDLAESVVKGHGDWEVDVSILKSDPAPDETLRDFGHSHCLSSNTKKKKIYILGVARGLEEGEL